MAAYCVHGEVIAYHQPLDQFTLAEVEARCSAEANRVINLALGLETDMATPTPGMVLAANRFTAADLLDDLYYRTSNGQGGVDGEGGFVVSASNLRRRARKELKEEVDRQQLGKSLIQVSEAPAAMSEFDETKW